MLVDGFLTNVGAAEFDVTAEYYGTDQYYEIDNEYETDIYEPKTGLVMAPSVVSENDGKTVSQMVSAERRPSIVIRTLSENLTVTDDNQELTIAEFVAKTDKRALAGFRIESMEEALLFAAYVEEYNIVDIMVIAEDSQILLAACNRKPGIHGMLDCGAYANTDVDMIDLVSKTNESNSRILVLPEELATEANIQYIQNRAISVWVKTSEEQVLEMILNGADGIISDNFESVYDVIESFEENTSVLTRNTVVAAHRGYYQTAPENTERAAKLAVEAGADAIECDVLLTKDGEVVINHDNTTGRLMNKNLQVAKSTLKELQALTFKSNSQAGDKIPTLREWFAAADRADLDDDVMYVIEIKTDNIAIIEPLVQIVKEMNMQDRVIFISFYEKQLEVIRLAMPNVAAGDLNSICTSTDDQATALKKLCDRMDGYGYFYNCYYDSQSIDVLRAARFRGIYVHPWTVNDRGVFETEYINNYHGITTDRPDFGIDYLNSVVAEKDTYTLEVYENNGVEIDARAYTRVGSEIEGENITMKQVSGIPVTWNAENKTLYATESGKAKVLFGAARQLTNTGKTYMVYSKPVTVDVIKREIPFTIVEQPSGESLEYGYEKDVELSVTIEEKQDISTAPTYQWYENNEPIDGATEAVYMVPTGKNVGEYQYFCKISCGNYQKDSEKATVTIEKKDLTITVNNAQRMYGEEDPEFTYTVSEGELVREDTAEDLDVTLFSTATKYSEVGAYVITGIAKNENYDITINDGILTLYPAQSLITIEDGKETIVLSDNETSVALKGINKTGDGTLFYSVTEGSDIIDISTDGILTPRKMGNAVVTVSMEATKNCKQAEAKTIAVTVLDTVPKDTVVVENKVRKVSEVALPTDWKWNAEDAKKAIAAGGSVEVTAEYMKDGKDTDNKLCQKVTITRNPCKISEILYTGVGEKAPTCVQKGIGHKECTLCREVLKKNIIVAASGHTWDEGRITQNPTATEKGEKVYICTTCEISKTENLVAIGIPQKGTEFADESNEARYRITAAGENGGTVEYVGAIDENAEEVNIPATIIKDGITYKVTGIKKGAFKNYEMLTKVTIGNNVKVIGKNAFYGCTELKTVNIGKGVETISDKAFCKCTGLTKITIPSKVTKIGKQAFYNCKKLKNITIKTTKLTSQRVGSKAFYGTTINETVKVPESKLDTYKEFLASKGVNAEADIKTW